MARRTSTVRARPRRTERAPNIAGAEPDECAPNGASRALQSRACRSWRDASAVEFDWVTGLAHVVLDADVISVSSLKGFAGGSSFDLLVDRGRFVVKAEAAVCVHAEAWACRTAVEAGVPAPIVLEVGEFDGANFVVLQWIDGEPLDRAADAVEVAGRALRAVHEIEGQGFGWLYEGRLDDGEPHAAHGSWLDAVTAMGNTSRLEDVGLLPTDTGERVRRVIERRRHRLEAVAAPRLLHGDVHLRHLLVRSEKLVGVIDWGDAAFGDPIFDLGRFRRCGRRALASLAAGYGLDLTPSNVDLIELYCCLWSINAMNLELGAGGDWFQQHVETVARTLALLESDRA